MERIDVMVRQDAESVFAFFELAGNSSSADRRTDRVSLGGIGVSPSSENTIGLNGGGSGRSGGSGFSLSG